ncbi:hypothetical protein BU23DRAFT_517258 [Bimuria novae-zelandiae CBS 107.79]|uniref:Aminoglycoside phosphotransferase domain-containing protein n=1 Tax=Bimuria novae-zelandiae CBS 107.79 TaxID=1447943 RepID=A0A6A5UPM8_9PLEO|nr:hypothetical protein BU23DRAFT_517258 [Bimuria novae-zelandiae CBS 107.79]
MSNQSQTDNSIPVYTIDASISALFTSHTTTTQGECDKRATSLLSAPVTPVPIQGAFSYTVVGGSPPRLVQFRCSESDIDMNLLHLARSIHGGLVASTISHGHIGLSQPLSIYIIERLPGITYMESCLTNGVTAALSPEQSQRQKNTVIDFARFFAASWKAPQPMETRSVQDSFMSKLQLLAQKLPSRFSDSVEELSNNLSLLFSEGYPAVLTHGDLCEMNFLVDPETGHLTGVIDWAEAGILPFGCALWGLENILGFMDRRGWHYFDSYQELEDLFWRSFKDSVGETLDGKWRAIQVARRIGVLFRYGFRWDEALRERIIVENDSGMKYLDAFIIGT